MVQSHVSYRWTTSQYQPGVRDRQETTIIANPNARQQGASKLALGAVYPIKSSSLLLPPIICSCWTG